MMKTALFLLLLSIIVTANDALYNQGEMLYFQNGCNNCHGPDAKGSTTYPRLANKPKKYLKQKFDYFKKGKVDTVSQQMMSQFIAPLSKEQMEALIEFLANHKEKHYNDVSDDILGGFGS